MSRKNQFVAGLFVLALCGFVVGGIETYRVIEFELNAQPATMRLADPEKGMVALDDVLGSRTLDVVYETEGEDVLVQRKLIPNDIAARLGAGEGVAITFLTNDTYRVFYYGQSPKMPWGWLIVGFVALAFAIYALRLRKREAEAE